LVDEWKMWRGGPARSEGIHSAGAVSIGPCAPTHAPERNAVMRYPFSMQIVPPPPPPGQPPEPPRDPDAPVPIEEPPLPLPVPPDAPPEPLIAVAAIRRVPRRPFGSRPVRR
jgi:hypothetical protein